jgi:hypothetical protein
VGAAAAGRRRRQGRGAVAGDVATLQVLWDRAGHAADPAATQPVGAGLRALRRATDRRDLEAAAAAVGGLRAAIAAARP